MKNAPNGIFHRKKRSSPASKVAKATCSKPMGTSVQSLNLLLKNNESKFKQDDYKRKADGSMPVGNADERSERSASEVIPVYPPIKQEAPERVLFLFYYRRISDLNPGEILNKKHGFKWYFSNQQCQVIPAFAGNKSGQFKPPFKSTTFLSFPQKFLLCKIK